MNDMDRIIQALEVRPDIEVPAEFARGVMNRLPQRKPRLRRVPATLHAGARFGRFALMLAMAALLAAMVLLAPSSRVSALWLSLQSLLFANFCVLAWWTATRYRHI